MAVGVKEDFFVTGGTLALEATCYVERAADRSLFQALESGRYCYVLNSRQMGKSSLCVRTKARLEAVGIRTAFVDLTRIGGVNVTPEQWYAGLCGEVGRSTGLRRQMLDFWTEHSHLSPMQRFFGALREAALDRSEAPIVVFFDEIDATLSLSFSVDEFFAGIRECYNRRVQDPAYSRLTFCLIGVAVPNDLVRNPRTTPFNIGERIPLRDFNLEELEPFGQALGEGGDACLRRIHYWTNGHPFLTQYLCHALLARTGNCSASTVDETVAREFFLAGARDTNINLADVSTRAINAGINETDPDRFKADLLSAYERAWTGHALPDDESNRVITSLKLSGLMRSEGRLLYVRNRVYQRVFDREWIRENMPGHEIRRQKRAYRRGFLLAGGLSALALAVIGTLASAAVMQARRADANLRIARVKEREARDNAVQARKAELRANGLVRERDTALRELRNSASGEREARKEADQRAREALHAKHAADRSAALALEAQALAESKKSEAESLSFEAYVSNLKVAESAINEKRFASARDVFPFLALQPKKGWEFGVLQRALVEKDRTYGGHKDALNDAAFSSDEGKIYTSDYSGAVRVFDVASRKLLRVSNWGYRSWSFTVSKVAPIAAASSMDGGWLSAMDLRTGRVLWKTDTGAPKLNKVVFSRDGRLLAGCGPSGSVVFVDAATGKVLDRFHLVDAELAALAIHPDNALFVAASLNGTAYICDRFTGQIVRKLMGHKDWVWGVAFSSAGDQVLTASVDHTARLWSTATGTQLATLAGHVDSVIQGENSEDGSRWVTCADDGTARVWDREGRLIDTLVSHQQAITAARFSASGTKIVTASRDATARVWTVDPTPATRLLAKFEKRVLSVDATANGDRIIAGSTGGAKLFDTRTGQVLREFPLEPSSESIGVAISPNGDYCAVVDSNANETKVYRWNSDRVVATFKRSLLCPRFAPDGKCFAIDQLDDRSIDLYEVGSWKRLRSLKGAKATIVDIRFSPDGSLIAASSYDRRLYLWRASDGKLLSDFEAFGGPVWPVAFSPNGRWLAAGDNLGNARIWDLRTLKIAMRSVGVTGTCEGFCFTPDSRRLIATGMRGDVRVLSVPDGRELVTFHAPTGENRRCTMLPDGRLVVGGGDGSLRIWQPSTTPLPR